MSISKDYGVILSSNTNEEIYFDLQDAQDILKHTWHIDKDGYPTTKINGIPQTMHSFLGYYYPDHHNRNKLDNRRSNLVQCTPQENNRNKSRGKNNTSGIIGVSWDKEKNKWRSRIAINGVNKNIGRFINFNDAVIARLKAEKEYFGEFAPQKHLYEQYNINE